MQLIDPKHSFYRPLYVRVAIVAVCLGWAIVEATTGAPIWAIAVGAVGVYAAWMLLLNYTPPTQEVAVPPRDDEDEPVT
ncbi:MAG: hypothetical protein ABWY49_08080 [Rhizobium sp.]